MAALTANEHEPPPPGGSNPSDAPAAVCRGDAPPAATAPAWLADAVDAVTATVTDPDLADYLRAITAACRGRRRCIPVADLEVLTVELSGPPWPVHAPAASTLGGGAR